MLAFRPALHNRQSGASLASLQRRRQMEDRDRKGALSSRKFQVIRALAVALLAAAALAPAPARSTELDRIQALADRGRVQEALRQLEGHLVGQPNQLDGQLLRGTLLAELGKSAEAERAFRQLEVQYPGQPEPTHNLAVMRAWARQPATAIRALAAIVDEHPTYETARSNLERIRDGAGRGAFDPLSSNAARLQLALTPRQRFSHAEAAAPEVTELRPVGEPRAEPESKPAAALPPIEPSHGAPELEESPPAPKADVESAAPPAPMTPPAPATPPPPAPAAEQVAVDPDPEPEAVPAPAADDLRAELESVVAAWAAAWSEQRVKEYLAFYAEGFQPTGYPSRAAWETVRRQRVAAPSFIEVTVALDSMTVERAGADEASVSFVQSYRSDRYSDTVRKTLGLVREDGAWRIRSEASQ